VGGENGNGNEAYKLTNKDLQNIAIGFVGVMGSAAAAGLAIDNFAETVTSGDMNLMSFISSLTGVVASLVAVGMSMKALIPTALLDKAMKAAQTAATDVLSASNVGLATSFVAAAAAAKAFIAALMTSPIGPILAIAAAVAVVIGLVAKLIQYNEKMKEQRAEIAVNDLEAAKATAELAEQNRELADSYDEAAKAAEEVSEKYRLGIATLQEYRAAQEAAGDAALEFSEDIVPRAKIALA